MVKLEPKDINYNFWVYDTSGVKTEVQPVLVSDTHRYKRVRLDLDGISKLEVRAEEKGFTPKRFVVELVNARSTDILLDVTPTFDIVFPDRYISNVSIRGKEVGDIHFLGVAVMCDVDVDMGGRITFSEDLRVSKVRLRRTSLLKFQGAVESSQIVVDVANVEFDPTGKAFYSMFSNFDIKSFKFSVKAREVGEGLRFLGGSVNLDVANMELPPLMAYWAVDGGIRPRDYYPVAASLELVYWENFRVPESLLRVPGLKVRRRVFPSSHVKWAGSQWGEYHPLGERLDAVGPSPMIYRGKLYFALEGKYITVIPVGYAHSFAVGRYPVDEGLILRLLLAYERTPATPEGEPVLTVASDREHMMSLVKKKNDVPLVAGGIVLPASDLAILSIYSEGHLFKVVIPEEEFVSLMREWISRLEEKGEIR